MGVVWRAVDERLERSVAVKQILAQPGMSEAERSSMRQRAMREAKNAARFQHPNAIVVFDIAEHSGDPCLVMEYLPSRSLSAVIADHGTMSLGEVARIGHQVASALVVAHRAGIVHRDIKPANILIDENGTAKITDFGISRAAGDLTLTQTGLIGGTPAYLAPELARGSDPAPASDVFSLGATLYHALEGQPPYGNSSNQLALLYTAANGQVIPPRQSGKATALLMSLLRVEPEDRPTMLEARDRLAALANDEKDTKTGTLVSPPLFNGGGRQPAAMPAEAPAPPAEPPPWQRSGAATAAPPAPPQQRSPRNPTAAFIPPPKPPQSTKQSSPKRTGIIIGSAVAAVAVLVVVLVVVLNSGDANEGGAQPPASNRAGTSTAPSSAPSSAAPADLGKTASSGSVDFNSAGQAVKAYLDGSGSAQAWALLTPAAQSVFGSQAAFQQYWSEHQIRGYNSIRADRGANADGSADMYVTIDGAGRVSWRVVDTGNGLRIDADTRLG